MTIHILFIMHVQLQKIVMVTVTEWDGMEKKISIIFSL